MFGVLSWIGGEGGASSWADHEGLPTSLEGGRVPSSDTAMRSAVRYSVDLFNRDLSPRLKSPAGSRVLRRWRSRSLRFGRRPLKGIAGAGLASHLRRHGLHSAEHGTVGWEMGWTWSDGSEVPRKAEAPGSLGREMGISACAGTAACDGELDSGHANASNRAMGEEGRAV